ncbi:hypothetical protein, partial [Pseudomonas sp. PA-3-6H]|uniref:hypothetical protein n=1 Tax=Pseudomonas sp. PA-3-6H TaxID=2665475 RepID=UPI001F2C00E7
SSEDQSTPAQALGLEDAVRSAYRGERCTYVLNSGYAIAISQPSQPAYGMDKRTKAVQKYEKPLKIGEPYLYCPYM